MVILIYVFLLLFCSAIMGLLGFWVGRCARKKPISDNNLPWTLYRNQIPSPTQIPNESGTCPPQCALEGHLNRAE
jgi:hypothetical protein